MEAERDFEKPKNNGHLLCRRRHPFARFCDAALLKRRAVVVPLVLLKKSVSHQLLQITIWLTLLGRKTRSQERKKAQAMMKKCEENEGDDLAPYREPRHLVITWR